MIIHRSSILRRVADIFGLQQAADKTPISSADVVQPVVEMGNRTTELMKDASATSTGNTTIYTTPADKDFYLTFIFASYKKDIACDCTACYLRVTTGDGATRDIQFPVVPLLASTDHLEVILTYPLRLARNSNIVMNSTFTAGTMTRSASAGGYILE
jgi:hypothetical protein